MAIKSWIFVFGVLFLLIECPTAQNLPLDLNWDSTIDQIETKLNIKFTDRNAELEIVPKRLRVHYVLPTDATTIGQLNEKGFGFIKGFPIVRVAIKVNEITNTIVYIEIKFQPNKTFADDLFTLLKNKYGEDYSQSDFVSSKNDYDRIVWHKDDGTLIIYENKYRPDYSSNYFIGVVYESPDYEFLEKVGDSIFIERTGFSIVRDVDPVLESLNENDKPSAIPDADKIRLFLDSVLFIESNFAILLDTVFNQNDNEIKNIFYNGNCLFVYNSVLKRYIKTLCNCLENLYKYNSRQELSFSEIIWNKMKDEINKMDLALFDFKIHMTKYKDLPMFEKILMPSYLAFIIMKVKLEILLQ